MLNEISIDGVVVEAPQPDRFSRNKIRDIVHDALNSSDYEFKWSNCQTQPYQGTLFDGTNSIDLYIYAWNITPADRNNPSEKRIQISRNVDDIGFNRSISRTEKTILLGLYNTPTGIPLIAAWDPAPSREHGQKSCYVQIEDLAEAIGNGIYATKDKNGFGIFTMVPSYLPTYVHLLKESNALSNIRSTVGLQEKLHQMEQQNRKNRIIRSVECLNASIQNLSLVERTAITRTRIGHGYFKEKLMSKYSCKCALCNIQLPAMLIASHIKEWADSNRDEKFDENNGLLLCAHHDALFDKHLISFTDDGTVIVSPTLTEDDIRVLRIDEIEPITVTTDMKPYLVFHRRKLRR